MALYDRKLDTMPDGVGYRLFGIDSTGKPVFPNNLRPDTNLLELRNGASTQEFAAYNFYTDASNYEKGIFSWAYSVNALAIGTGQAGTGAARNVILLRGGAAALTLGSGSNLSANNLYFTPDNTLDIGAAAATRPRNGNFAGYLLSKKLGVAQATAVTLTSDDSGKVYHNTGASARADYTLPSAVAGMFFDFICTDADGVRVIAASGDDISLGSSTSAAAGRIDSTTPYSALRLFAVDATHWVAMSSTGTWAVT